MPRAILLKTRNTPDDPYDIAFRSKTPFNPVFIPVLQHAKVNAPELRNILQNDPQNHYTALIMTSQRAVEALDDAMSSLTGEQMRGLRGMTVYTVGPATALAITKLEFSTVVGADTGNGTALANLIVQTFSQEQEGSLARLPLLFLVGDKRRDIIPQRLAENQIPLTELTVYETTVAASFETDLDKVLADKADGDVEWVIFFSPTGVDIAFNKLNKLGSVKLATIGPTTEEYLRKEWGVIPDMVSKKPEPISMVQGIMEQL